MGKEYIPDGKNPSQNKSKERKVSRRKFFGNMSKTAIAIGAIGALPAIDKKSNIFAQRDTSPKTHTRTNARAMEAYELRQEAAEYNLRTTPRRLRRRNNGDEKTFSNFIGSFTKGLQHNQDGEVNRNAFLLLLQAVNTEKSEDFEQIPLGGDRKLVNPQAGLAFDLEGRDCFSLTMPPAPSFSSRELGAEIAENYWMALLRDVPFDEYPNNQIANDAAADLNRYGQDFKGAKNLNGQVTPDLLFRGLTPGDKVGPYLSQFFYLPIYFGANEVSQRIETVKIIADGGQDYMTDFNSWLEVQNGFTPQNGDIFDSTPRYMRLGRDIGQFVHVDVLFQAYFQAFLALSSLGASFDGRNPYNDSNNQEGFGTFGEPHVATLLCEVSTRALKAVWNQKWIVHRRFRPEVFGERIDRKLFHNANYPIDSEILNSLNDSNRLGKYFNNGNAFLPMAFPEGSPTHPSYGAGHATVAGACVTVLKAFFDEDFVIPNPVIPDSTGQVLVPYSGSQNLTVGGELNKLASNISLGRNIAGVHWRSDGTESVTLGEDIAISVLRDQKRTYNEQFRGFKLTKFDGETITI